LGLKNFYLKKFGCGDWKLVSLHPAFADNRIDKDWPEGAMTYKEFIDSLLAKGFVES